jgi:hypothetical protein
MASATGVVAGGTSAPKNILTHTHTLLSIKSILCRGQQTGEQSRADVSAQALLFVRLWTSDFSFIVRLLARVCRNKGATVSETANSVISDLGLCHGVRSSCFGRQGRLRCGGTKGTRGGTRIGIALEQRG